jgi:catalase
MEGVPVEIVKQQIVHCYRADPAGVAKAMGIDFTPQTIAAEFMPPLEQIALP